MKWYAGHNQMHQSKSGARRGLALGATLAFVGLGMGTVLPLTSMAISTWGWRMAFAVIGLAPLLVTLPIAIFILRDPPAEQKWSHPEADGLSFRETVGIATFWRLSGAYLTKYLAGAADPFPYP